MAVRAIQLVATLATVSFVSVYGATAVRFNSFARDSGADRESLDSIAHIAALATESRTLLMQQSAKGDLASRISAVALRAEIVSQARTSTDPFARLVFSGVARDLVRAADDILADPQLSPEARRAIGIQLTRLATANALPLDSAEVFTWLDHVVERSFDANGRLTATGLRIAQAMKGARQPSVAARALEPLLFAGADDARNARISARRALSSVHASPRHSELWTTMVVRPAVDGLAAQTEVAKRLPQLIAITRR
jgi:hypothetical protein